MRFRIRVLLFIVLLCGSFARAQDGATAALRGHVWAANGRGLAGVAVSVQAAGRAGIARSAETGSDGGYQLLALEPGTYDVAVTTRGPRTQTVHGVTVALGRTSVLNFEIANELRENITVTTEAATSPDIFAAPTDTTIAPEEVQDLPAQGRRWQDLALLGPLASAADAGESRVSSAAIATTQNTYSLDGLRDTRFFTGGARGSHRLSLGNAQSAIREFRISSSTTAAGWSGLGATLDVSTRRATERRGGSAFVQSRSNLFAAVDPSALVTRYNGGAPTTMLAKPRDTRWQWGATIFGAVPRTPLLAHVAYEEEHRDFPALSSPASASFYSLSPKQVALLQTRGVTVARQRDALAYLDSLSGTVARQANEWSLLPRVDWNAGARAAMTFTWSHTSRTSPAGLRGQTVVNRGAASFGDDHISTDAVLAQWSQVLSSRMNNRLAFGYSRDLERQQAQAALAQEPHTGPNGYSPQVDLGGDFITGKPSTLGRRRYPDERRIQGSDALTYAAHGWSLQAGGAVSLIDEQINSLSNEEGTYTYANSSTGGRAGALVDWITDYTFSSAAYPNGGCPTIYAANHYFCFQSFSQSFGAQGIAFRTGELSWYLQAHWQPRASLAVTAGARYEVFQLPAAQQPNAALDALFGDFATTSALPRDGNNVAPYASVAWSPGASRRTVVRIGVGINYGRVPGATIWSALTRTSLPGSTRTIHLTPQTVIDAGCASAGNNFGYPSTYVCTPGAATLRTTSAMMFANNFAMPAVGQAQMSVEHQWGAALLSATYTGFAARALPNSTEVNVARSTSTAAFRVARSDDHGEAGVRNGDTFVLPIYTARVNASFGPVTAIVSNASASHHSLALAVQRPLRKGWSLRASWTYAKTLDFGQDHSALPLANGQLDPFNVRYDRAASDLDRRHRVVLASFYETRVGGNSARARALNGWTIAPLFTASAGRPYSYLVSGGASLNGGAESINGTGGLRYLPSVGRNTLRLPWSENLNLRVARRVRMGEALRLQIYADGFNTLNSGNVSRVQQRAFLVGDKVSGVTPLVFQDAATIAAEGLTTQAFGMRRGSGTLLARQREFQFGFRVEW